MKPPKYRACTECGQNTTIIERMTSIRLGTPLECNACRLVRASA